MRDEEEMLEKVVGESLEEASRESGEEGVAARARKVEAVPSKTEVEDLKLDHAVFRSWYPRCEKGRAEAYGRGKRGGETGDVPTVSLDYTYTHSEQEKGMPICAVKDNRTKMAMAKGVPGTGAQEYAVEAARNFRWATRIQKGDHEDRQSAGDFSAKGGSQDGGERGDCHGGGTG